MRAGAGGADPFGLSAGLALTGTGSERGHFSVKSTDRAAGADHAKKVLFKKKKLSQQSSRLPRNLCEPELGRTQGRAPHGHQVCACGRVCVFDTINLQMKNWLTIV